MISMAQDEDIRDLVRLVNSAYRGEASKQGWTTEADLLQGELRTDEESINELMHSGSFLKYTEGNELQGCVYLQKQSSHPPGSAANQRLYLGMLCVSPAAQARGIGKKLLAASEEHAREKSCSSIIMTVISVRHELIGWYERHGYKQTGETKPFPADDKFGKPVIALEFLELEKKLL
jgi:ribosomal protein S18 acetylase RimI-like enzyme